MLNESYFYHFLYINYLIYISTVLQHDASLDIIISFKSNADKNNPVQKYFL